MATSLQEQNDEVSAVDDEISCPICLDEFEEPKCLPNCAHNVCQLCLEGMVKKRNEAIECPVCRVESIIPNGGVAAFPKNHLLVRLIERTPGRKEKQSIKEAMKNCNEKLESAKAALKDMEDRFETGKSQAEQTRNMIKSVAENVVTMVRAQEQKMLDEIDQKLSEIRHEGTFEAHKSNAVELCENASGCVQTVQDILQNGELSDLKDLKEALVEELDDFSKSLEIRMFWANCEFTEPFDASFKETDLVERFIENECSLGKLTINAGTASTPQVAEASASVLSVWEAAPVAPRGRDYSSSGSLIQTIDSSSCRIAKFNPFSVAAFRNSDHFVVLDEEMKRVHIFDGEGDTLRSFRIMYGDLWDIAVSNENEIVVVNRESNRLLHYDMNGNFKKKRFVTTPRENVKFTSLFVDIHGRFVISSSPVMGEDIKPCILVYSPSGKLALSFGEGRLQSPEKAAFLNGKFFVPDSGRVVVFDKNGNFLEEIGCGQLESPSSLAADYAKGNLVVSDCGNSQIHIYSQDGQLLHCFQTEHPPKQIALTQNYKNLLICCQTDDASKNKIQMVTYT